MIIFEDENRGENKKLYASFLIQYNNNWQMLTNTTSVLVKDVFFIQKAAKSYKNV